MLELAESIIRAIIILVAAVLCFLLGLGIGYFLGVGI
jgi:hypothetical protein